MRRDRSRDWLIPPGRRAASPAFDERHKALQTSKCSSINGPNRLTAADDVVAPKVIASWQCHGGTNKRSEDDETKRLSQDIRSGDGRGVDRFGGVQRPAAR